MEKVLSLLNEQQRKAVEHTEGPSLVIAGAGSGKTRVLTTRIAYLIYKGVDPFHILALTFTNKAAREMKERIENMIGAEARNLWMGTFHSIFARILRIEAEKIGFPRNFTIYDTDDSKSLIKQIIKEEGLDPKTYRPSYVHSRISAAKNSLIRPRDYLESSEIQSEDLAAGRPRMGDLYRIYVHRCFKAGAMDFDDLLLKTYDLLNDNPAVLNKYQHLFRYVLIDEFQDTNRVQYLIVRLLSSVHRNLTVVGDDAQSIYSFRGANIRNILNFEKDYPELKIFKLEQNYRSTKVIVHASDNIIKNNKYQLPKNLWTSNPFGQKINLLKVSSENEEGQLIAEIIKKEIENNAYNFNDFVVLYRTNAQSRPFEEAFRKYAIPYRIIGSLSFYQRKEIKDLLAYFRFTFNPNDEEALRRIINFPARGIGDVTYNKLLVLANENNCTVWDILTRIHEFSFSSRIQNVLNNFVYLIKGFQVESQKSNAFETAKFIAKQSGLLSLYAEDKTVEGIARYENIQTLFSAIQSFVENEENEDKSLPVFLQEIALLTDADTQDDDEENKVTLMTVHSAKGLEFPVVFVAGMEENLFPSALSMNSREELEEERRLFYVAVTRAKEKVFLSYATTRYRWGNIVYSEPSRFLEEINPEYYDYSYFYNPEKQTASRPEKVEKNIYIRKAPTKPPKPANPDFQAEDIQVLKPGDLIEHERFGKGEVKQVEGNGKNSKVDIEFEQYGMKKILVRFAKMRKL